MSNNTNGRKFGAAGLYWWPGTCRPHGDRGRRSWRNALWRGPSDSEQLLPQAQATRGHGKAHGCAPASPEKVPWWSYHNGRFWWEEICRRKLGKQACAGAGVRIISGSRANAHFVTWPWSRGNAAPLGAAPSHRRIICTESELVRTPPSNRFIQLGLN